jgi:hypothetical protein
LSGDLVTDVDDVAHALLGRCDHCFCVAVQSGNQRILATPRANVMQT